MAGKCRIVLLILTLLALAAGPAFGRTNPDDFTIEATFGIGGYYKARQPGPIVVNIGNTGEIFEGWVSANVGAWVPPTFYNRPVVIPPGQKTRVEIGCYGCYDDSVCTVPVSVMSEDGDVLAEVDVTAYLLGLQDTILVHIGEPKDSLTSLFNGTNPGFLNMAEARLDSSTMLISYPPRIFPVVYNPDEFPENPLLLDTVGLVTTNLTTWLSLDSEARDKILQYVLHGGNLLIYWVPGVDPVDGWESDTLLPVEPLSAVREITLEPYAQTIARLPLLDTLESTIPQDIMALGRDLEGNAVGLSEESLIAGGPGPGFVVSSDIPQFPPWQKPEAYTSVLVKPTVPSIKVRMDESDNPILVVRRLGVGYAGFAAFNPFEGNPSARDIPINMLAAYGLLNPNCPSRIQATDSVMAFKDLFEPRIQNFFRQGTISGSSIVMRWLDALGPAMIYLLFLPVIVLIARGKGNIILALFILWSVIFTGVILYRRTNPTVDMVRINEANLYWCEALSPDEPVEIPTTELFSAQAYTATSSVPRTVTWQHEDGLLDEYVYPQIWPYGSLTIDTWPVISLPDLNFGTMTTNSSTTTDRTFVYRRLAPELSASGALTVGPEHAEFELNAHLPFPVTYGRLVVASSNLSIAHGLDSLEGEIHVANTIVEGEEIWRHESLFPDFDGIFPGRPPGNNWTEVATERLGYPLKRLWDIVSSMPVNRAQVYTQSPETGRPYQAYIILASSGLASEITIDRGELERHAVTIIVISIPVVYDDEI